MLKILTGALLGEGEYKVGGYDPRERKAEMQQQIRLVPENEVLFDVTIKQLADLAPDGVTEDELSQFMRGGAP